MLLHKVPLIPYDDRTVLVKIIWLKWNNFRGSNHKNNSHLCPHYVKTGKNMYIYVKNIDFQ